MSDATKAAAPRFEQYDQRIADAMMRGNNEKPDGLPGFLGARFVRFEPGRLVAEMEVKPELITIMGALHGGAMAAFVDHVLGCVLYPLMKRGQWAATTEFKLNYLTAVRKGKLVAESTVVALTSRTAVVRVEVTNDGRPACIAQGTLLISEPPAKSNPPAST
jgi:1,4-dihydroxy-2-naphthoyl-CoA hydrolase